MPIANVSLQVIPITKGDPYKIVDKVIELIESYEVKYIVGPMETTMEGEFDVLVEIVKKAQEICIQEGAARVLSMVKIDYRPNGITMDEKIAKYR